MSLAVNKSFIFKVKGGYKNRNYQTKSILKMGNAYFENG